MSEEIKKKIKKVAFLRRFFIDLENFQKCRKLKKIYQLHSSGICPSGKDVPVIVSLTSIASRMKFLPLCLQTLLSQRCKPDRLILWLSEYDINGNKVIDKNRIPKELHRLKKFGLEVRFVEDIGSYTKLIPALKEFPDAVIVTADDDIVYPKDWLERLYKSYQENPSMIHSYEARLICFNEKQELDHYLNWPTEFEGEQKGLRIMPLGVDGVLYPPKVFDEEVFNEKVFRSICPKADDVWFKAMSLLNNMPCKKVFSENKGFPLVPGSQVVSLFSENTFLNDMQIKAVFNKYDLIGKLLELS